jgi:hypothetical protein
VGSAAVPADRAATASWLHPDTAAAPSDIAGTGLFAIADLRGGMAVARVTDPASVVTGADGWVGNHSCDPNLWWGADGALVARRGIVTGEELTVDYATSTGDAGYLLRCHCESTRCRGMVAGDDWRIPELQRRYAGHWAPLPHRLIKSEAGAR